MAKQDKVAPKAGKLSGRPGTKPVATSEVKPETTEEVETDSQDLAPATTPAAPPPAPVAEPSTKPATKPKPETVVNESNDNVPDSKSRELTTAQKVSHFKKKLDGLYKLATELATVDNRFRDIRNTIQKIIKLVDPGALVQAAAAEKSRRRDQPDPKPVIQKSVQRQVQKPQLQMAGEKRPVIRPMHTGNSGTSAPGSFSTNKPGPKIPFGRAKKKV